MGVIYKITSPSGKVYVGKTYDLRKRINSHKCDTRKGSSIILHNSIRKYGWEAHVIEVIEEVADELLNEREMFWITELKTYCHENPMGLNMTKGGEGQRGSWMHDTERRKWYSERFKGKGGPFYGKKHTEENKIAQSERAKKWALETGKTIPKWGAEKGRLKVIRAVLCYDKYGNFLKKYESVISADRELNIDHSSITMVCQGKRTHVNELVFRYYEPNYPLNIQVGEIKFPGTKRPVLYLNSQLQITKEYPSSQEASDDLKVPKTTINRAACYNNYKPIRTGHIFIYKDLHEKLSKQVI